jgi:quercetin dioxygenase-like cupin family protein
VKRESNVFVNGTEQQWMTVDNGVERKLLGFGPDLTMIHVKFRKGSVGYIHKHPHRQVSYIESGSFEVNIAGKKRVQRAGDCYYVPADIEHGVVALEDGSLIDVFTPCREDIIAGHFPDNSHEDKKAPRNNEDRERPSQREEEITS